MTQSEFVGTDGVKKTTLEINANIVDLVGKRDTNAQPVQAQPVYQTPAQAYEEIAQNKVARAAQQPQHDDIPF
jgi:single-strand DNA-binding protein